MADTNSNVDLFFDRYAAALLARDEKTIAALYAVPALILFPGHAIPVTDAARTEQFFASAWGQYEGVDTVDRDLTIMGLAPARSGRTSPGPTTASPASASATSSSMAWTATRSPSSRRWAEPTRRTACDGGHSSAACPHSDGDRR